MPKMNSISDNQKPPIDAIAAIKYAVENIEDHFERRAFLDMWLHGDWADMRRDFPDVFRLNL